MPNKDLREQIMTILAEIPNELDEKLADQLLDLITKARGESYKKGRNSVGGESVDEAWERGRRAGRQSYEILDKSGQYYQTRESIISLLCMAWWFKSWDEAQLSERRVEQIHDFMRIFDNYVDKRIEDSYTPQPPISKGETK